MRIKFIVSFYSILNTSPISALYHLGVMILGLAFFKDFVPQRPQVERGRSFQLTEEDLFRASRAVLHVTRTCIKNIYNIKIIIGFDKTHVVLRATTLDKATYSCPGHLSDISSSGVIMG